MFFIHVVSRFYTLVSVLQFLYMFGGAFYSAEIEHVNIHETKPFVENIKDTLYVYIESEK